MGHNLCKDHNQLLLSPGGEGDPLYPNNTHTYIFTITHIQSLQVVVKCSSDHTMKVWFITMGDWPTLFT